MAGASGKCNCGEAGETTGDDVTVRAIRLQCIKQCGAASVRDKQGFRWRLRRRRATFSDNAWRNLSERDSVLLKGCARFVRAGKINAQNGAGNQNRK